MSEHVSKDIILSNFFWRFAERFGAQGVQFLVSVILARLLAPETYGTIALITVFIAVLNVFVDSGMANALIQKKKADDLDFSTVFYFNVSMCCFLYLCMFLAAPLIANFYDHVELTHVIRVLSITLIISGVKNVQQAHISRTMQFKRFFFATLGGTLGAAVVGIIIAYSGGGVWALVIQQIFNATINTVILWITVKWRPKKMFSFERLKGLFSFGSKMLVSSLIDTVYKNIRQLVIGKIYSSSDLGYYNQAKKFPELIVTNIIPSIDGVLLPALSKSQDDITRVKVMTRRSIMTSIYFMAPMMIGLADCATPLVELVYTEKWLPCVPYLRIFCITNMFYPIHTANLNAIKALGRSDLFLKLEIQKRIIGIILLLFTVRLGVLAMAYSLLASSLASQIINTWPNKKLINYSYLEQLKDILPSILLATVMGIAVFLVGYLNLPNILMLIVQIISGVILYIGGSILFKLEAYKYVISLIRPIVMKVLKKRNG